MGSISRYSTLNLAFDCICTRDEAITLKPVDLTLEVEYVGFPVLDSSLVHMQSKAKLNVEYLEIDPTLLQNPANLLDPDWISNYGRQFSEWAIVCLYSPKSQVKMEFLSLLVPMFPHEPSCIHKMYLQLVCLMVNPESIVHYSEFFLFRYPS